MARMMYSIYDKKAETYNNPFPGENDLVMIRDLQVRLEQMKESQLFKYPDDFIVVQVGMFNPTNGDLTQVHMRDVMELRQVVEEIQREES